MDKIAEITGMSPELIQQIINTVLIFAAGLGSALILHLRTQIKTAKEERIAAVEQIRSEIKLKEDAQAANNTEKENLFGLVREQIQAMNKLSDVIREDNQEKRKIERDVETERNQTIKENSLAITQLKDTLETQASRFQQTETLMKNVSGDVGRFDKQLDAFFKELRRSLDEFNGGQETHSKAASDRHEAILVKLGEIQALLSPKTDEKEQESMEVEK